MTFSKVLRTAFLGRLVPPTTRELLGGIVLYAIGGLMVYDVLRAWWVGVDMPTWHWALFVPVMLLVVWLYETAQR